MFVGLYLCCFYFSVSYSENKEQSLDTANTINVKIRERRCWTTSRTFFRSISLSENSSLPHETKTLLKSKRKQQVLCLDFTDCGRRNVSIWILAGSDTPDQPERCGSTHANRTSAGYTETKRQTWHHVSVPTLPVTSSHCRCTRTVILRLLRRPHRPGSRPRNLELKESGVRDALTCQTSQVSS